MEAILKHFKEQWWNTHEIYYLNHFQVYGSVAWNVFTRLHVQKFGNKSRQLPCVPRTRQALEEETSKGPRHHGGARPHSLWREVLQTQPSFALKVVFRQLSALQSPFLLWGTPPPSLFFFFNFFPGRQVVFVFGNLLLCRFWPWLCLK